MSPKNARLLTTIGSTTFVKISFSLREIKIEMFVTQIAKTWPGLNSFSLEWITNLRYRLRFRDFKVYVVKDFCSDEILRTNGSRNSKRDRISSSLILKHSSR